MKDTVTLLYKILFAVLALFITASVATAQQQSNPSAQSSSTESEKQAGTNFFSSFASTRFAITGRGIVKGAPFSAVGTTETTQILSDGSRVVHRIVENIYRDSEGSTRVETKMDKKPESHFFISTLSDVVSGMTYILDARNHRALQFPLSIGPGPRQTKIITQQSPPDDIMQIAGGKVESLGTQVIEGLKVEGVRATTIIPASEMRNNQPGKVIYERWYSRELHGDILIKCTDPRFGEAVFRVTNIDRSEPAHELFVIPADYKVNEFKLKASAGSESNAPVNIKLDRGDRISVENRTTGHIRVIGWDKDFIEAKATSERGEEAVRFSVEGDSSAKRIWLKADYAKREEPQTPRSEPKPEPKPEATPLKRAPPPLPKAPAKPTIGPPGQFRLPSTFDKPGISYSDGPPLRDGQPIEVDLEVRVPQYAEIEPVKVVKSPVEISDIDTSLSIFGDRGDVILKNVREAEVHTRNGAIEIENASGFVDLVTTSGPIRVHRSGGDVRVFSINGDVDIECASARVNVDNTSGTISLTNIGGDVAASTSDGNIKFTGAIREGGRYNIKSMAGAIEMAVPERAVGFTAVLSSYRGIIENDFDLKDKLKDKQASEHKEKVNRRVIGSYGSGRAQIILDTFDGKINLHKIAPGAMKECKMQN
ncbi:MAG TPA: DUF4097 family beta strand repeat-containing protein [Pyrinomonadaceae bacterium]|nr:DUF4097 family beta strand repeat-containing protein [Pyrinomonadaceae bacterium]